LNVPISINTNTPVNLVQSVSDEDSIASYNHMTVSIKLISGSGQLSVTQGATVVNANNFNAQLTLAEANSVLNSLQFVSTSANVANVIVSVNDNGVQGVCPTGFEFLRQSDGSCPRNTAIKFVINVSSGSSSLTSSIATSSAIGAVFVAGVALALFISKKIKNVGDKESWKDFDEENMKDLAQTNPIFEEEMKRSSLNPLYVSSAEEEDSKNL